MFESKRVKNFRLSIIKQIPRVPNDKATKELLESKSLADLFIDYINWASRLVAIRQRKIQIAPSATNDPRWSKLKYEINVLLEKVRSGDDLVPHLSLQAQKQGFTPASSAKSADADRWADKDFILNVMGFHHFHLGTMMETAGHVTRTDNVLFAVVTRDKFRALAIFNHSVFDKTSTITSKMSEERERLWSIFDSESSPGIPPGAVYIPSIIMTSGHSYHHVQLADHYARLIREIDPKLDDQCFLRKIYTNSGVVAPDRPKLKWSFDFLDLGLYDEAQKLFFVLHNGPT